MTDNPVAKRIREYVPPMALHAELLADAADEIERLEAGRDEDAELLRRQAAIIERLERENEKHKQYAQTLLDSISVLSEKLGA